MHSKQVDDEMVLYDPDGNLVHRLNLTATLIWQSCDGIQSPEQIAVKLAQTFQVSLAQARSDVYRTMQKLHNLGLLQVKEPA